LRTRPDIDSIKSDDNPLGLVFWQAGVKLRSGLTPDKAMEMSATPLGVGLSPWQGWGAKRQPRH